MIIRNYNDFVSALLEAGFSMGGSNSENIFAVVPFAWVDEPPYETPVRWHTGDPDTDPWEWRMRVLDERDDIAYAKIFFRKSGFITKEWYPYFLTCRRFDGHGGIKTFRDEYYNGTISHEAKRIYETIGEHGSLPLHVIKQFAGFDKTDKSKFERALIELQMKLYITMCGRAQKVSQMGFEYGWFSTVFCTTESFWGGEVFRRAGSCSCREAVDKITEKIYSLNPDADKKQIEKFIYGRQIF